MPEQPPSIACQRLSGGGGERTCNRPRVALALTGTGEMTKRTLCNRSSGERNKGRGANEPCSARRDRSPLPHELQLLRAQHGLVGPVRGVVERAMRPRVKHQKRHIRCAVCEWPGPTPTKIAPFHHE